MAAAAKQPKKAPTNGQTTLDTYVSLLKRVSRGEVSRSDSVEWYLKKPLRALIDEGLVMAPSIQRDAENNKKLIMTITPSGAAALISWQNFLNENKWWYKVGAALTRFMWVFLGALIATFVKLTSNGV